MHKSPIAFFLPNLAGGGAERAFVELANRFVGFEVAVDMVLVQSKGIYLTEISPGIRVFDLQGRGTIASLLKLRKYVRNRRPAVVMSGLDTANVANWLACWLAGVPDTAVLTQRSMLSISWQQSQPRSASLWIRLLGLIYRQARLVISNSKSAANELCANLGVRSERSAVIYNSVDAVTINGLAANTLNHDWASHGATPLILLVGNLTKMKDIPTALRAFARLRKARECRLVVLGEGPERAKLQRLIRSLDVQDSVKLIGFDPNPFRWMARARVLVSSSLSEGCPNVILQALACGLQVVATYGLGGTAEILENGRWGRLVPVGDDEALAGAIAKTLDAPLPVDVRERAAMFNPDLTAKQYLNLILPGWQAKTNEGS